MRWAYEQRGGSRVLVQYLNEDPDPPPIPLTGFIMQAMGFDRKGSSYTKNGLTIAYDGVNWWNGADRCNTKQELEKLMT